MHEVAAAEASLATLNLFLNFAIGAIVLGLVLEYAPDYWSKLGRVASHRISKAGEILVMLGVAGELALHIQSEQIEGKIKNRQRTEIISLQERTAPRRLSTAQCSGIVDVLKPFSGRKARVATYVTDGEGSTLGQMIVVCLRAANINTEAGMATILPWSGFFSGVSVDGEDKELVDVLKNALSVEGGLVVTPGKGYFAGNQATGTETENAQAVLIVVGVKPVEPVTFK